MTPLLLFFLLGQKLILSLKNHASFKFTDLCVLLFTDQVAFKVYTFLSILNPKVQYGSPDSDLGESTMNQILDKKES